MYATLEMRNSVVGKYDYIFRTMNLTNIAYVKIHLLIGIYSKSSRNHIVAPIFCFWSLGSHIFTIDLVLTKGFEFELRLDLHSG